jgi:hypothetical protein
MKKIIILLLICTCIFAQRKIKYGDFTPQLKSDLKDTTKNIVKDSLTFVGDVSKDTILIIPYNYLEADRIKIGTGLPFDGFNTEGSFSYIEFSSGGRFYLSDDTLSFDNRDIIIDGLVLDWRPENYNQYFGTIEDLVNNKDGTEIDTVTKVSTPQRYMYFNNDSSVIRANTTEAVDSLVAINEGTIEIWINPDSVGTSNRVFLSIADTTNTSDYWAFLVNIDATPHIAIDARNATTSFVYRLEGNNEVRANEWQQIIITGGGGNRFDLYLNTIKQTISWNDDTDTTSFTYGNFDAFTDVKLQLGGNKDGTAGQYKGKIGDVRVYVNKRLTQSEINQNFKARRKNYLGY